jgi:MoxR-vWA-beta-propeller ternary system protein
MSAVEFVGGLIESGRVCVGRDPAAPAELEVAVRRLDTDQRANLPPTCPELEPQAAAWALLSLYRACQALVYRDIDAESVKKWLAQPCPRRPDARVHYSVDLSFRFLPDVLKLARGIAADDPLVTGLMSVFAQWPLSSVGVKDLPIANADLLLDDPALCRLYTDRIIEKEDLARLGDARVAEQVRAALGTHRELAPRLAQELDRLAHKAEEVNAGRTSTGS